MSLKNLSFVKWLIELPEEQKRWATLICCGLIIVFQTRRYEIREFEYKKECDNRFDKFRLEKNAKLDQKDIQIDMLQKDKYDNMLIFKQLYIETEMLKIKVKTNDSIRKKY